jgi:hypothetical protein
MSSRPLDDGIGERKAFVVAGACPSAESSLSSNSKTVSQSRRTSRTARLAAGWVEPFASAGRSRSKRVIDRDRPAENPSLAVSAMVRLAADPQVNVVEVVDLARGIQGHALSASSLAGI